MPEEEVAFSLLQARKFLQSVWGDVRPDACLVCGSGWGEVVTALSPTSCVAYEKLPGMGATMVSGHHGKLWLTEPGGLKVIVFQGRRHFYEGAGWGPVLFPALLARELQAGTFLLTNAAGGIREDLIPGDLMVVSDHLNFIGSNPLIGRILHPSVPRFPDQSEVYDKGLVNCIHASGKAAGVETKEGIYLALSGPAFETPAEIRAYAKLGADAVGMSTVPEAMAAHAMGLKVGAISCISNLAAGRSSERLTHEEVERTSTVALPKMMRLLSGLFSLLTT